MLAPAMCYRSSACCTCAQSTLKQKQRPKLSRQQRQQLLKQARLALAWTRQQQLAWVALLLAACLRWQGWAVQQQQQLLLVLQLALLLAAMPRMAAERLARPPLRQSTVARTATSLQLCWALP